MTKYQIKNWDQLFENNKTRDRNFTKFACIPNHAYDLSLPFILKEKEGSSIFGILCLAILFLSKQKKPRNGWLTLDGTENGKPINLDSLSFYWNIPSKDIEYAFDFLSRKELDIMLATGGDAKSIDSVVIRNDAPKEEKKTIPLTDDDFIKTLKQNSAYRHIDIDRELAKMDVWFLTPKGKGRQKTRRFVINWLNKLDAPMHLKYQGDPSKSEEESFFSKRTRILNTPSHLLGSNERGLKELYMQEDSEIRDKSSKQNTSNSISKLQAIREKEKSETI